jgi:hypothetical protein
MQKKLNQQMKTKLLLIMVLAAATQFVPVTYGQGPQDQGGGWRRHRNERFANLPEPDRQKLQAARQKAMQDPAVQTARQKMRQAHREFRDAMRTAMLKADPTIQPVLDKLPKGGERGERDEN